MCANYIDIKSSNAVAWIIDASCGRITLVRDGVENRSNLGNPITMFAVNLRNKGITWRCVPGTRQK